ncbi:MAG: DUF4040 domain-containing protein [Deltaproteobacteria bacterium]|nr:DUF4040 domain-containing protein [Deltaproteobacteria bacterium]
MEAAVTALDVLLAGALPVLAWRALATDDLHEAVVFFIALGLVAALAWARLDAPDIALVEAAVGAGVTGSLFVTTLRARGLRPPASPAPRRARIALAVLTIASALGIGAALAALPAEPPGLGELVRASLPETGVQHTVTAVLLNVRGYDTLLEMAVLVAAVLAVLARAPSPSARPAARPAAPDDDPARPLIAVLARLLVPGIILVAGYLLWRGAFAPGGAFQAAAVLAGGGILAILAGRRAPDPHARAVRRGLVFGPGAFVLIAAVPLIAGRHVLEYPEGWAKVLIVAVEVALTFSIALTLVLFFPASGEKGT